MKWPILNHANPTKSSHPVFMHRPEPLAEAPLNGMKADYYALKDEVNATGGLIEGVPLAEPATSETVRIREGTLAVTDGPFAESKEQLAGYVVFECESPERAVEIASRFPDVKFGAIEVRPIMDLSGLEM